MNMVIYRSKLRSAMCVGGAFVLLLPMLADLTPGNQPRIGNRDSSFNTLILLRESGPARTVVAGDFGRADGRIGGTAKWLARLAAHDAGIPFAGSNALRALHSTTHLDSALIRIQSGRSPPAAIHSSSLER